MIRIANNHPPLRAADTAEEGPAGPRCSYSGCGRPQGRHRQWQCHPQRPAVCGRAPGSERGHDCECLWRGVLLCTDPFLSFLYQAVSEDALCNSSVLMLHLVRGRCNHILHCMHGMHMTLFLQGRTTFPFCPCGHGFMPHPDFPSVGTDGFRRTDVWTNLDELVSLLGKLSANAPPGVLVASTDMLLTTASKHGESVEMPKLCGQSCHLQRPFLLKALSPT